MLSKAFRERRWWRWSLILNRGKKSKSVFDFFTYSRETGFSFFYYKVGHLYQPIDPSNEIDRVSKFDNFLSFGARQKSLGQIFLKLWFFKDFFAKNLNWIFFNFFKISCRINKGVYFCLSKNANICIA